jgi:Flp pilus assembly protein TadD
MNPNFERGLILYNQNRYDLAEQEFRQALAADPDNPRGHSMLAHCLCEREQFKEATEEAQLAIHKSPDSPHSHYTLAYIYHRRAHNDEALTAVGEAVRLDLSAPTITPCVLEYFSRSGAGRMRWSPLIEAWNAIPITSGPPICGRWPW